MPRARRRLARPSVWAALAGSFTAGLLCTSFAVAGFTSATSSAGSVTTKKVFLGTRTTAAWDAWDNSNGTTGVDASDVLASVDARFKTTGNWATTFSATRYFDFDYFASAPAGITASAATFDLTYASNNASAACFYFEVYKLSTTTLLGTHGSSGSTIGCVSGTTQTAFSTSIAAEVTGTGIANDLRIRVYMKQAGSSAAQIDAGTTSVTTTLGTQTLYEKSSTDRSTGTATTTAWSLATAADSAFLVDANNWATTFSSTKWMRYTFPASMVPSGATITGVTLNHSYADNTTGTTSVYYEVYSGVTLLGSHGSSGTPYSSATSTTFVTDTISLTEVTTVAQANGLIVRVYVKNSGSKKSNHDLATLGVSYYVD